VWLLAYVVHVRLHVRGQGLLGSKLLLRFKLCACLVLASSFSNTLQIPSASS
jgi:hypothetical protein